MPVTTTAVLGDLHIPFHSRRAVDLTITALTDTKPDEIILNGDVADCFAVSRFIKLPEHMHQASFQSEVDGVAELFKTLRSTFPDAKITWIFGNHEYRLDCYLIQKAPELYGLRGLSLAEQCGALDCGISIVYSKTRESSIQVGQRLLIGHFDKISKHAGQTARLLLEQKGVSLIQGHSHRLGCSAKRLYDRDIIAYEGGCLCDRQPLYADRPDWQLGFSLLYKDSDSDFFHVDLVPIAEIRHARRTTAKLWCNGRIYQN